MEFQKLKRWKANGHTNYVAMTNGPFVNYSDLEKQLLKLQELVFQAINNKDMAKKNARLIDEAITIMLGKK